MTARWYLVKYVRDMRRNEPRNIGVILEVDDKAYPRFEESIGPSERTNYAAWLNYWRHLLTQPDWRATLANRRPGANYYIEPGGERLAGQISDPEAFADWLFDTLVLPPGSMFVSKEPPP